MIPTEEEKQKIQEAQLANPDVPLGSAEQFLLTLSSISELSARLQLWAFKMDYEATEKVHTNSNSAFGDETEGEEGACWGESENRLGVKPTEHVSHRFGSMCKACVRLSLLCVLVPTSAEQQHSYVIASLQNTHFYYPPSDLAQTKNASGRRSSKTTSCKFLRHFCRMHSSYICPLKAPLGRTALPRLDSAGWFWLWEI